MSVLESDLNVDEVQRRTLRVLWASSILSRGAFSAMFPVSVLAIKDILDNETWAGLGSGASTAGGAIAATVLATIMTRRGRNHGLTLGFTVALGGGVLGVIAIQASSLWLFLMAMALLGAGNGTSNLSRYAAADLSSPERRSRDLSTVIFASTFGAVLFPLSIGITGDIAESFDLDRNTGGFGLSAILLVLAAGTVFLFMRPDPLKVAGGVDATATRKSHAVPFRQAIAVAWSHPIARLAVVALVISQTVMVMVMTMTPLHMDEHGHSDGIIGAVISTHTAGMFAFAPVAGWISDKYGRLPTIGLSGITLIVATAMTALAGEAPEVLMFPGLFLLGLGWSFGIVAGSALLSESVADSERVIVQGAADTATAIASGTGAIASGFVLSMAGFHILSVIGMAGSGALMIHAAFERRVVRPA
ncbi:MAG: MFS transporter [Acidimicrobiales bacterium]|nr:MFS transporter [Acidimicrobiales bacterium]